MKGLFEFQRHHGPQVENPWLKRFRPLGDFKNTINMLRGEEITTWLPHFWSCDYLYISNQRNKTMYTKCHNIYTEWNETHLLFQACSMVPAAHNLHQLPGWLLFLQWMLFVCILLARILLQVDMTVDRSGPLRTGSVQEAAPVPYHLSLPQPAFLDHQWSHRWWLLGSTLKSFHFRPWFYDAELRIAPTHILQF